MFIWLGSGRARRRRVGAPALWLDRAANAGLPVPPGAVVLDEFRRCALDLGLALESSGRVLIPDAELWHNTLLDSAHLPRFRRPVSVYPIPADDAAEPAPIAHTVDFGDAHAAARAVAAAWSGAGAGRRDTLIIETIAAAATGTAMTTAGNDAPNDIVTRDGDTFSLPQLRSWRGSDKARPPYARRLQQLLRGARRTLGPGEWRIHWADDGHICWLVLVAAAGEQPRLETPGLAV